MEPVKVGDPLIFNKGFGCVSAVLPGGERVLVAMQAGTGFFMPTSLAQVLSHSFKMTYDPPELMS